jgi:excisionase family DNA binding protein
MLNKQEGAYSILKANKRGDSMNEKTTTDTRQSEYMTLKEAAAFSGTTYATIKRDIEKSVLPAYRIGHKYFINRRDLADYRGAGLEGKPADGYTIRQIMEMIPLSYAFIINLIHDKHLPAVKYGRNYIIDKEDFEDFLEKNKA